jgi:flagellar biosynthesis anti-sigma factor FlgM
MRIDNNGIPPNANTPATEAVTPAKSGKSGGAGGSVSRSDVLGSDQAQLSVDLEKVQALAGKASSFPEIRQAKVQALGYNIRNGTYSVTSEQTAEALIAHLQIRSAA